MYCRTTNPPTSLTVSQLNRQVAQLFEAQLGRVWVEGEVSNFTAAASGHWYFSIKDDRAAVKAVMFRARAARVGFMPKQGEKYRFYAAVTLYEPRGDYQLQVEALERVGVGNLHAEFERLKQQLSSEGLFNQDSKRQPIAVPRRIGVVTSLAAAALRDVLSTMKRRAPHVEVYVYPTAVQGAEAADQLCAALGKAIADQQVQTILLVRGGGSLEDLWSFNNEHLARLIAASPIPIISGVGHETDFTIADFAADVRAPTPTAAAELCCISLQQSSVQLLGVLRRLQQNQARIIERCSLRLDKTTARLISPWQRLQQMQQRFRSIEQRLQRVTPVYIPTLRFRQLAHRLARTQPETMKAKQRTSELQLRLLQSWRQHHKQHKQRLLMALQTLQALNPESVLDRGYAIVRNEKDEIIKHSADVKLNENLSIQLAQGHLIVKLNKKHDLL